MSTWAPSVRRPADWPEDPSAGATLRELHERHRRRLDVSALDEPSWLEPLLIRMVDLLELEEGWDSYGGAAIDAANIEDALNFLHGVMRDDTRLPSVAPMSSGGIGLSWRTDDVEVDLSFDRARESEVFVTLGDREWSAPVDEGQSLFRDVIDRLAR